jgi:hypothetical protein
VGECRLSLTLLIPIGFCGITSVWQSLENDCLRDYLQVPKVCAIVFSILFYYFPQDERYAFETRPWL